MQNTELFQCFPSYKPMATARIIQSILHTNCKIIIDVEDSIQDIENIENTIELKAKARLDFAEIARLLPNIKFCVRVNSVTGNEFEKDRALLNQFFNCIEWVFLSKVETSKDIDLFYKDSFYNHQIIVIIETRKGLENIDEILNTKFKDRIKFVFFGNYDYHLDTNTYPIREQYAEEYWQLVEPIISKVEEHHLNFGNCAYANIGDTNSLSFAVMRLNKFCKRSFALFSLHKTQTFHYKKLIDDNNLIQPILNGNLTSNFTMESFAKYKQKGRSFAVENKRIITPQEYLLLLRRQNGPD